jgi:beta-lactamase class A
MKIKNKKISYSLATLFALVLSMVTFFATVAWKNKQFNTMQNDLSKNYYCSVNIKRLQDQKYIKPILIVDEDCESEDLVSIKQKVTDIITREKNNGNLTSASFYMKEYSNNDWTEVNDGEFYEPGSLFKVPILMVALKINEEHPGFLNKTVKYDTPMDINKNVHFPSKSIKFGNSYTVRQLIDYMIRYSDNQATYLLEKNINPDYLRKMFKDLNLEVPNVSADHYYFNVKNYSIFMRAIYNAGYLSIEDSEYAAELLTKTEFKEGILKGLPKNIVVAHKFGESGTDKENQLHESGIVYLDSKPYMLTIMTKGKAMNNLANVIAQISSAVYSEMYNAESK